MIHWRSSAGYIVDTCRIDRIKLVGVKPTKPCNGKAKLQDEKTTSLDLLNQETLLFDPAPPDPDALRAVLAFPSTYSFGITSLGYQIVWATLAQRHDVDVRRLFTAVSYTHLTLPTKRIV